jgi:toxin ParE1/3/4
MVREVVWTEPAWQDLESTADFIARDSTIYAAAFVQEVKVAVGSLAQYAERGLVVPEFRDHEIRELLVRPYRLIYQLSNDRISILTLNHGARRSGRTLRPQRLDVG